MTTQNKPVVDPNLAYEYLSRAQYLLESPRPTGQSNSWIQHAEAINDQGNYVSPESERAVAWCTIGVVKAVTHYDETDPDKAYKYILSLLNMANPNVILEGSLPKVNDHTQFQQVIRMFEKAKLLAMKMESKA